MRWRLQVWSISASECFLLRWMIQTFKLQKMFRTEGEKSREDNKTTDQTKFSFVFDLRGRRHPVLPEHFSEKSRRHSQITESRAFHAKSRKSPLFWYKIAEKSRKSRAQNHGVRDKSRVLATLIAMLTLALLIK